MSDEPPVVPEISDMEALREAAIRGARAFAQPADAEDIGQDVVLDHLLRAPDWRKPEAAAHSAGRFRAIDHFRRSARAVPTPDDQLAQMGGETPSPEAVIAVRLFVEDLLERASSRLSKKEYRALVVLYRTGGSIADAARIIAEATGEHPESLRTYARRAVEKAREMVGENDE